MPTVGPPGRREGKSPSPAGSSRPPYPAVPFARSLHGPCWPPLPTAATSNQYVCPSPQGPQGTSFAASVVDAVFTVPFGDPAVVTSSFDGSAVHFTFRLPAGQPGAQGAQGDAGEVSAAQLADAFAPPPLATFPADPGDFSDPPTQAELRAFAAYVEETRLALVR